MPIFDLAKATHCVPAVGKYKTANDSVSHKNKSLPLPHNTSPCSVLWSTEFKPYTQRETL